MGTPFRVVSVHLARLVVLAVKAAAALIVPPATQAATDAATDAATEAASEALHAASSPLPALVGLVVGVVVAAVVGVVTRGAARPLRASSAAVVPLLALAPVVLTEGAAVRLRLGVFLVWRRKEATRNRFKELVRQSVGSAVQRFEGKNRHGAGTPTGSGSWLRSDKGCSLTYEGTPDWRRSRFTGPGPRAAGAGIASTGSEGEGWRCG